MNRIGITLTPREPYMAWARSIDDRVEMVWDLVRGRIIAED